MKKHRLDQMRLGAVGVQSALLKNQYPSRALNAYGLGTIRQ